MNLEDELKKFIDISKKDTFEERYVNEKNIHLYHKYKKKDITDIIGEYEKNQYNQEAIKELNKETIEYINYLIDSASSTYNTNILDIEKLLNTIYFKNARLNGLNMDKDLKKELDEVEKKAYQKAFNFAIKKAEMWAKEGNGEEMDFELYKCAKYLSKNYLKNEDLENAIKKMTEVRNNGYLKAQLPTYKSLTNKMNETYTTKNAIKTCHDILSTIANLVRYINETKISKIPLDEFEKTKIKAMKMAVSSVYRSFENSAQKGEDLRNLEEELKILLGFVPSFDEKLAFKYKTKVAKILKKYYHYDLT